MIRLKSIGIAFFAIICTLNFIGIVNAHITSFYVYAETDWGSGAGITGSLTADEGIDKIHWYVGNSDVTTTHDGATSVYEYLGTFDGHVKSRKYTVDAIVHFADGTTIETATAKCWIGKPIITSFVGPDTGVEGSATVTSQYFTGWAFGFSGSTYAYNGTNRTLGATGWFRQQEWDGENGHLVDQKRDDTQPIDNKFKPGETYYVYPNPMEIEFPQDGPLDVGESRYFNAHTHLQVYGQIDGLFRVDDWEADTKQQEGDTAVEFTDKDNPEW